MQVKVHHWKLFVHDVRLPAGGLGGAWHLQTDKVGVEGDARVGSQRDEVVVPLALLELLLQVRAHLVDGAALWASRLLSWRGQHSRRCSLAARVDGWHGGERAAAA